MNTILIVGGYGQFGGRLSRRLSQIKSLEVLVAGRNKAKAEAFCLEHGGNLEPVLFDRNSNLAHQLKEHAPTILVDAAGPFQTVFGTDYDLPRACMQMGIHYIDLSDSGTFTKGIAALDQDAKLADIAIVSGASSVPALSGAVVREALNRFLQIKSIEGGISPGGKINIGLSVTQAVLSYLGKPLKVFRGGEWGEEAGFSRQHEQLVDIDSEKSLIRRYGLCDAPDLLLFPDLFPDVETVRFHGSMELGIIHNTLCFLAWLQNRGIVRNLENQARFFAWCGTQLGRFASERGCMYMVIKGLDQAGKLSTLQWNLIASDGDGPFIPILAAEILVRRWLEEMPEPGARSAAMEISLKEFEALFAELSIKTGFAGRQETPYLFKKVLCDQFDTLPVELQDGHSVSSFKVLRGRIDVKRGKNPVANLIANCIGFAKSNTDAPLTVSMDAQGTTEVWTREIDGKAFKSTLSPGHSPGEICERFGPIKFKILFRIENAKLHYDIVSERFLGVPLPRFLIPKSVAHERAEDGKFVFDVDITLPLLGRLIAYKGWLS